MCTMKLRSLIGTKSFYRTVLAIAVPVMLQSGITQFVGLLDNLMVGRLGTEQMSGVAIANQLIFIFNLCIFGGLSGAGIFGAQFAGKKDVEGIRSVFRFKLIVCILICAICLIAFGFWNAPLISLFLHEGSAEGDLALTLRYGQEYMRIMLLGLVPYALSQAYASTLRETGETVRPMAASIAAVLTNLVLNYLLIFGKLGLPAMGAAGAATATVVSRFVELGLIMYWSHAHPERTPFFMDAYRSLRVPRALALHIVQKGAPLLLNEALWSVGMSFLNQCYSTRGLAVIAAVNISSTVSQLFNIVFASLGSSIGIVVGNLLGAGKREEARVTDWQMIAFSVATCFALGGLLAATSGLIPELYNTTAEVKALAAAFLFISACSMPFHAFTHACYFTLRSGGQTKITMLFDSGYVWLVCIPVAFVLSRFTSIAIVPMFLICTALEIVKCIAGYLFVKSGKWIRTIVPGAVSET